MSFNIFQKNTLVDPSAMNDNFYYIGDGDLLPRGGLSLTAEDSVYDLGNSDNRYNNIHVQDIDTVSDLVNSWNLISRVVLSTTSTLITIQNLNGDIDELYEIIIRANISTAGASGDIYISVGDTTTNILTGTNYGYQQVKVATSTVSAVRASTSGFKIGYYTTGITSTNEIIYSDSYIYAKSGNERTALTKSQDNVSGKYINTLHYLASILRDTTTNITTMRIWGAGASTTFCTGTLIEIWAKR